MASMFPSHTRLVTLGTSYEGREILGLRVGVSPPITDPSDPDEPLLPPRRPRKTILITGGAHAREWISVAAVLYTAHELVTTYSKRATTRRLVDNFDWILVPTLNPDGYEYTWTSDRLWRKNRQPTALRFCNGMDLDGAFGYRFDKDAAGKNNPCSEAWAGGHAWEAHEARRVREWIGNLTDPQIGGDDLVAYVDLHSYSQQILYPYAYTCEAIPPTLENLEELAMGLARAMTRIGGRGSEYRIAPACAGNVVTTGEGRKRVETRLPRLESGGGSPLDWFYHEVGVRFAFQIKLRDTGSYGYLLPPEEIVPQGREVFAAVNHLGRFLLGEIGVASAKNVDVDENDVDDEADNVLAESEATSAVDEDDEVREAIALEAYNDDTGRVEEGEGEEDGFLSKLEFRRRRR
jgi:extracellular matrix protein 14